MNINERFLSELRVLVQSGELTPEQMTKVARVFNKENTAWRVAIAAQLRDMVEEWEESMGQDDKSLYSLGLRRAIDLLTGESSLEQLPILEKPDTPNE